MSSVELCPAWIMGARAKARTKVTHCAVRSIGFWYHLASQTDQHLGLCTRLRTPNSGTWQFQTGFCFPPLVWDNGVSRRSVLPSLQYAESRVEAGPEVPVVQGPRDEDFRANSRSHRLIERSTAVWEYCFFVFISVSSGYYSQERNKWILRF